MDDLTAHWLHTIEDKLEAERREKYEKNPPFKWQRFNKKTKRWMDLTNSKEIEKIFMFDYMSQGMKTTNFKLKSGATIYFNEFGDKILIEKGVRSNLRRVDLEEGGEGGEETDKERIEREMEVINRRLWYFEETVTDKTLEKPRFSKVFMERWAELTGKTEKELKADLKRRENISKIISRFYDPLSRRIESKLSNKEIVLKCIADVAKKLSIAEDDIIRTLIK